MKKIKFPSILILTCIASFMMFYGIAFAEYHEWKWGTTNSNGAYVQTNADWLDSKYTSTIYANGRTTWSDTGARMTAVNASDSSAKVFLISVDKQTWSNNGWGNLEAWTWMFKTAAGPECYSGPSASNNICKGSNASVNYGLIYFNDNITPSSSARKSALIAHELGHAVGISHTNVSPVVQQSIMNPAITTYTPTQYDIDNMNGKY